MKKFLALLVISASIAACGGGVAVAPTASLAPVAVAPSSTATSTPEDITAEPVVEPETEAPTQTPSIGTYVAGDTITITNNGEDWAEVTIDKVSEHKTYGDYDKAAKGNTFIQARVTYKALADGVDYNPFDWQVFVDDQAVDNFASVVDGPNPQLNSGTLPKGRTAKGWVVYEVPKDGRVLMSYAGNVFSNEAPIFEVVVRSK